MQKRMTIKKLILLWIMQRVHNGQTEIKNSDMEAVRRMGIEKYNIYHTASTYEREFRRLRAKPNPSPKISDFELIRKGNRNRESVWKVITTDSQSSLF